jgi:hypothetical protein
MNEDLILEETPHDYLDWHYPYFTIDEMVCQHTGFLGYDARFMDSLISLREKCGFGFPVTSYFRHPTHPIESAKIKAGKKNGGTHTTGKAIDIGVDRERAFILIKVALDMGCFTGIGINQKGNSRFIHLDTCTTQDGFARPTIWSY